MLLASHVSDLFATIAPYQRALDFHLERHNLLASNVAHVDTPGYKPKDMERTDAVSEFGAILETALERPNERHIPVTGAGGPEGRVFQDLSAGGGADGNFVSLDREAAKLAANQLRYDIVSVLVSSELQGLMSAAGDMKA